MSLTIPNSIANGQSADGNEVGANFAAIEAWANTDAAEKSYVDERHHTATFTRDTNIALNGTGPVGTISFESEANDLDGWWSSGTTFTCPEDGVYLITFEVLFTAPPPGGWSLSFNGDISTYDGLAPGTPSAFISTSARRSSGGGAIYAHAGDKFTVPYQCFGTWSSISFDQVRLHITKMS